MAFEGANFEEVDEVVLSGAPAMTIAARERDRDPDRIVKEGFDVSPRDLATVANEEEPEADHDRREVNRCSTKEIVPDMAKDIRSRLQRLQKDGQTDHEVRRSLQWMKKKAEKRMAETM